MTPEEIIETLGMLPHPEGGHYVETWRHAGTDGTRGAGTAIYFLLQAGERSHWHRVDAAEIWHWYAGAPLELSTSADGQAVTITTLGNHLAAGARPQVIVPAGVWQSAVSVGAWTLIGCTVSPAFEFSGFEMAPPDWAPRGRDAP
jgi:predicted cupin superfamily sugar epimerase